MNTSVRLVLIFLALIAFSACVRAQVDEICREFGETPTREFTRQGRSQPYIFGRIVLKGLSGDAKRPRVTAIYSDSMQPASRLLIGESGNYCFKRPGTGGSLLIDVDGVEAARKSVADSGEVRQ